LPGMTGDERHRAMSNPPPTAHDSHVKWLEIAAAIVLAFASLLTAWSSYQASRWGRIQALQGAAVMAKMLESTRLSTLGGEDTLIDIIAFTHWLEAVSAQNQPLADFYRSRFREEFKPAFEAWLAYHPLEVAEAPASPFVMPEYLPKRQQAAAALQSEAGEIQKEVRAASDNAAYYVRNTLFLASALFFVGISRMYSLPKVRIAFQAIALGMLLIGLFYVITGPIA
jgi:hypothetical protein